jgi:hypothetical protein
MADDVLRMRATLVSDETLAKIREIGREIGLMPQKAKPHLAEVNTGFAKLTETMKHFGEETLRAIPALEEFGLGAASAGVAAGLFFSKLGSVAKQMVELKYRSQELGMSERAIRAWTGAAQEAGISAQSMMQSLEGFHDVAEGLKYNIGGVRDQLYSLGAGPVVRAMEAATVQGEKMKIAFAFKDVLWKESPWKAEQFFKMIGLGSDAARLSYEQYVESYEKKQPFSQEDLDRAQKFHTSLVQLGEAFEGLSQRMLIPLMPWLTDRITEVNHLIDNIERLKAMSQEERKERAETAQKRLEVLRAQPPLPFYDPFGVKRLEQQKKQEEPKPTGKQSSLWDWIVPPAAAEGLPSPAGMAAAQGIPLPRRKPYVPGDAKQDAIYPVGSDKFWLKALGAASFGLAPELAIGRGLGVDVGTTMITHLPEEIMGGGIPPAPPAPPAPRAPPLPLPATAVEMNRRQEEWRKARRQRQSSLPEGSYQVAGPAFAPTPPGGPGGSRADTEDTIKDGVYAALVEFESYVSAAGGTAMASLGAPGAPGALGGAPGGAAPGAVPGAPGIPGAAPGGLPGASVPGTVTGITGGPPGGIQGPGGAGGITAPTGTPIQRQGMATVTTPSGKKFQVDARFAENFKGFLSDYERAGGTLGSATGTLGTRPNRSGHPIGTAIDINQIGRNIRGGTGRSLSVAEENALAAKWGFVSGANWRSPDTGHFGIRSVEAARNALVAQGVSPGVATDIAKGVAGDGKTVRGSVFGPAPGWPSDPTQGGLKGPSGLSIAQPGIALPSKAGLGKMFEVTTPEGRKFMLPQVDIGPFAKGRGIDITAAAAKQMGYTSKNFPTDKPFTYREVGSRDAIDRHINGAQKVEGSVNIQVHSDGTAARTKASTNGGLFQQTTIRNHKQMQPTDAPSGPIQMA